MHPRRELEHLAAVHLHSAALGIVEVRASRCPGSQRWTPPAPSAPSSKPRKPPCVDRLQHDRAGAVAEEDERRAVRPSRGSSRARRRRRRAPARASPAASIAVGLRDRVHEAGAAGREVVGGGFAGAQRVGDERRRRREHHVGRHRRDDHEVEVAAARRPPRSSAARAAGSAMSVSASSLVAMRRSRMPVRSRIHSSEVSTYVREVVVRDDALRHVHAEAGDRRSGRRSPGRSRQRSTAKVSVAARRQLVADVRRRLAAADRPAHAARSRSVSVEHVARHDDALEAAVVDAGEEARSCRGSPPRRARRPRPPAPSPRRSARRASPAGRGSARQNHSSAASPLARDDTRGPARARAPRRGGGTVRGAG